MHIFVAADLFGTGEYTNILLEDFAKRPSLMDLQREAETAINNEMLARGPQGPAMAPTAGTTSSPFELSPKRRVSEAPNYNNPNFNYSPQRRPSGGGHHPPSGVGANGAPLPFHATYFFIYKRGEVSPAYNGKGAGGVATGSPSLWEALETGGLLSDYCQVFAVNGGVTDGHRSAASALVSSPSSGSSSAVSPRLGVEDVCFPATMPAFIKARMI